MYQAILLQKALERLVDVLCERYQPERIILFGSLAYGKAHEDSDIDLFIVKDTILPFYQRMAEIRRLVSDVRSGIPIDFIVLTPNELQERVLKGDPFIREILKKGRLLYEQQTE